MQGYLFSRPLAPARFSEYLQQSAARIGARRARGAA
jgi:EAL domain-containing protein (putative c-di-GMP-specific phosphodiesterase class I)